MAIRMPSGQLFGYVLEPLREDADSHLYRGRQPEDPSPVLIVALDAEESSREALRRLEHEYSLASDLDPSWAAKPLKLVHDETRTALILTDPGGEPLDQILEREHEQSLDLTRFLHIAIGLANSLGQMHRRGLIHKDIKPANVLVGGDGNLWFTGFGIASRLLREHQAPEPPEIIAGTLAYMAPEQTGRMNRSMDTRSDLYSLGVTLYQMATGRLPFVAADAMEWVHCHIARQPIPPENIVKLPPPLSAIIMRLLAKTVEDRYQTAMGLEADLRRCLEDWESRGCIDAFPLGAHDISDRLLIPEKLYGREIEIRTLLAAFDRVVANGSAELVLVSGYSGVGKSSVVNELHKVLVPPRGLFAAGKFDQYKRDIPYTTLAQAFQTLVRQILVKSEADVGQWRDALRDAVGPNGQLIVNLIPEVEFLIGKQLPVPDLPPQEAQSRFQFVFRRFLGTFARPEHPLALFLDDLQWLDTATLELLEYLITDPEVRHLLLIGAYRNNEVSSSHPLVRMIEVIRKAGARMQEIVLAPLSREDIGRLLADALHCELQTADPLAQLVHEKTGGNPFFAIQFLTALAEEGLLKFDRNVTAWTWDQELIRAKGYTDNVADLMVGKLKRLRNTTQEALQKLACLGNVVEIATLVLVYGESEDDIHSALWEATRTGLILRQECSYAFLHDRVQEAAYALIPEGERTAAHLRIGRVLLASMTAESLDEHLFDVANQLNRGAFLLTDHDEKTQVAKIDLSAGRKAKAAAAYASAREYFSAGAVLLDEGEWASQYELTFSLWLERAECELLSGNLEQAEQLMMELLQRAESKVDQAAVYHLKSHLHVLRSENPQAVDSSLKCLGLFGINIPAHPSQEQVQIEYETVFRNLAGRPIETLIDLPLMTDLELQAAMGLLSALLDAAFFTDLRLYCLLLCRMVNIGLQHGTSGAFAHACAWLGGLLGPGFHRYHESYRFIKLGCDVVEKHGFIAHKSKTHYAMGIGAFWMQSLTTAIDCIQKAFYIAIETGNLTTACYCKFQSITAMIDRSDPLDAVWREAERNLAFVRNAGFHDMAELIVSQQRLIATLQGRTTNFSTFSDSQCDEAAFEAQLTDHRMSTLVCGYWIIKLQARVLMDDYGAALTAFQRATPVLWALTSQLPWFDYFYYAALTVAALYENASPDEQQTWRDLLTAHQEQLREWAETNPPTFADKHALVSAEIARLEKRDVDAMRLYEQAAHLARENGFVQNEALAHELAARYYLARGLEKVAHTYLRSARTCYDRWGAFGKVKQLDERYPHLHEELTPDSSATIGQPIGQLDVETVVKASQALSSEIVLNKLIEKLMQIAVEHAGAERGLLILLQGDELHIEAQITTGHGGAEVTVRRAAVTPEDLPQSALQYVMRTRESIVLDDASINNLYAEDEYVRAKHARSILCLPIVKQSKLVGALYLENHLTPGAFTSDRVAVLELLASQAAISLENAHLYSGLQRSEAFLAEAQSISHTGSFGWSVPSGQLEWSQESFNIYEYDRAITPTLELAFRRIHPDDRDLVRQTLDRAIERGADFDIEHRLLMPNGSVKYVHVLASALKIASGNIEFVGAVTDVTAASQAEEKIRQSERELRQVLDLSPQHILEFGLNGDRFYSNQAALDYYGLTLQEWQNVDGAGLLHPEEAEVSMRERAEGFRMGSPFELEVRLRRGDGQYRWFLIRYNPIRNEQGSITRWYAAATDIEDRKQAEQRLLNENVALREEIDKTWMFEEIVGNSKLLQNVLSRISKVAPTDSTVLITGETGTGKELVARAIHKRSQRAAHAFVSVNCAAVPRDLIASELFGHEKGAFTGAMQRRPGRFELAEGGTIFLDEVGELPAETQIALLRVLQEREFARVGGTGTIRTDVRVLAATNRDLEAANVAGTFRSDLYYRLNVFPIEMPALRQRREDIPMLVEYFLDRFARNAGKRFQAVSRKSLDLLESYPWPGNIRELQNVIERSVIVCETENFSVDESWLSRQPAATQPAGDTGLFRKLPSQEKAIIENALSESGGRVYGPSGAASRLGMPRSTLESKIRSLKIDKNRFKTSSYSNK